MTGTFYEQKWQNWKKIISVDFTVDFKRSKPSIKTTQNWHKFKICYILEGFNILDMCDSIDCQNSGTCTEGKCECADRFSGELCETGTSPWII